MESAGRKLTFLKDTPDVVWAVSRVGDFMREGGGCCGRAEIAGRGSAPFEECRANEELESDEGGDWISGKAEDEQWLGHRAMGEKERLAGFDFDSP